MKKSIRITTALVLGGIIVLGAVYIRSTAASQEAGAIVAVSNREEVRGYITPADSDNDGISDWEEELTEKTLREAEDLQELNIKKDSTTTEDNTLTGTFAKTFFEQYIRTKASGNLTTATKEQFLADSIEGLQTQVTDTLFTEADVSRGETGGEAIRTYGNEIMRILNSHSFETENEVVILGKALQANDPKKLTELDLIIEGYAAILAETRALNVPPELTKEHVNLLNVYQAIHNDIAGMRSSFDDPLYALLRMKRYKDDAAALQISLAAIYKNIKDAGVSYKVDEEGKGGDWFLK